MFGIDKLASGGTNVSINLGGTIDPNLYKLQTAMMEAVGDNPALRETFVQRLGEKTDTDASDPSRVLTYLPQRELDKS